MDLTLDEAALTLGVTVRQVRYMIQIGRLSARKDGSRWRVRREDLPVGAGALAVRQRSVEHLRSVSDEVLGPSPDSMSGQPSRAAPHGLGTLRAWQIGGPLLADLVAACGAEHPAVDALRQGLFAIARGCHRFHPGHKAEAYAEARDAISAALAILLLDGEPNLARLAARTETELLPAVAGLIRRTEREPRRAP